MGDPPRLRPWWPKWPLRCPRRGRNSALRAAALVLGAARRRSCGSLFERLIDVPENIVERFQPDRQPDHFGQYAGGTLLFVVELTVRRRRGMNHQRLGITDIGEVRKKLHRFDKAHACLRASLDAEGENPARA